MSMGREYLDDYAYEIDNGMEPGFYLDAGDEDSTEEAEDADAFSALSARQFPLQDGKFTVRPHGENYLIEAEIADGGKTVRVRTADWPPAADFFKAEFALSLNAWLYIAIVPHLNADLAKELAKAIAEEVRPPAMPETIVMEVEAPFTSGDLYLITEEIKEALRCRAFDAAHDSETKCAAKDALAAKLAALSERAVEAVRNA